MNAWFNPELSLEWLRALRLNVEMPPVPLQQQAGAGGRGTKAAVVWIAELTTVLALESDS